MFNYPPENMRLIDDNTKLSVEVIHSNRVYQQLMITIGKGCWISYMVPGFEDGYTNKWLDLEELCGEGTEVIISVSDR